jgi:hypothetical protein
LKDKEVSEQLEAQLKLQQEKEVKDNEDAEQQQAQLKLLQDQEFKEKEEAEQQQALTDIQPPSNTSITNEVLEMYTNSVEQLPASLPYRSSVGDNNAHPAKKRKVTRRRTKNKGATTFAEGTNESENDGEKNDNDNSDVDDWDLECVLQSANTARRILWQRGHAATVPSKVRELIEKATVRRVEDAIEPLKTLGFAIIEDMTEVFHPKNRCTKEQRDYIDKC